MENFLTFQDCMVIFTSHDMVETIREMRPSSYPTVIIPLDLNQVEKTEETELRSNMT